MDIAGERYGKLTVLDLAARPPSGRNRIMWRCRCDCQNIRIVEQSNLRAGNTKSCGCSRDAHRKVMNRSHGQSKTELYRIWKEMKIAGRCEEWQDFMQFHAWAYANGYEEHLKLRCMGKFQPDDCSWVEDGKQNKFKLPMNDEGVPWVYIANQRGISSRVFSLRLERGISPEEAATTDVYVAPSNGHGVTYRSLAKRRGLSCHGYRFRLSIGWSPEKAARLPASGRDLMRRRKPPWQTWRSFALSNGISYATYRSRIIRGWDFDRATRQILWQNG